MFRQLRSSLSSFSRTVPSLLRTSRVSIAGPALLLTRASSTVTRPISKSHISAFRATSRFMSNDINIQTTEVAQEEEGPTTGEVFEVKSMDDLRKRVSNAENLTVIDFYANWCGPCKMIAPLMRMAAEKHLDTVFLKVDVDSQPQIAQSFMIEAMPTLVFVKGGDTVDIHVGALRAERLEELIEQHRDRLVLQDRK